MLALPCCASTPSVGSRVATDDGEQFYDDRCGRCHDPVPRHGYPASQWPAIVQRMRSEARLTEAETKRILLWLQEGRR